MLIDCVHSPSAEAMRAAGVTAVSRYLSWADQRDTLGKVIHKPEYNQLLAGGFAVMLNWEYDAQDYLGGAMRGAAHAQEAIRQARALGYPDGCAIYGSADHDVTRVDWLGTGRPYYMAFSSGLRVAGYRAGIYGPWDVLTWAQQDDVADLFWQAGMSTSWSGGRNAQPWPGAHLRQRRQVYVGGLDCDINDVLIPNFGAASASTLEETMTVLLTVHRPDGTGRTGLADGVGGWHWIPDQQALAEVQAATGLAIRDVTEDMAQRAYGVVLEPVAAPVSVQVDAGQVASALAANPALLAAVAKAVNDDAKTRREGWS